MKKLMAVSATVLLSLSLAMPALAQEEQKTKSVGIRGGLNIATLSGDVTQVDSRLGFAVGIFGGRRFGEFWGIQAVLSYSQKGGKDTGAVGNEAAERTISFDYFELQVPLVLRPRVELGSVSLRLYGGPYAAVNTRCNVKIETPSSVSDSDCEDAQDAPIIKDLDYGLVFGIGFDLLGRSSGGLSLDGTYDLGLSNINDIPNSGTLNNRVLQILIGYVHTF